MLAKVDRFAKYLVRDAEFVEVVDVELEREMLELKRAERAQLQVLRQRLAVPRLGLERLGNEVTHEAVFANGLASNLLLERNTIEEDCQFGPDGGRHLLNERRVVKN